MDAIKIKINGVEWKGDEEPIEEESPYRMEVINGDFHLGNTVTVRLADGSQYTRKVRDEKISGLYILIKNTKYYDTDIIKKEENTTAQHNLSKYEVIKSIMDDATLDETAKVWKIEMFLKGWITAEDATEKSKYGI